MSALATLQPPAAPAAPVKEEPLYEVVNGQKVELPPMSIFSSRIGAKLLTALEVHAASHGLGQAVGEALFILDAEKNLRRRPDVAFVSAAKWPLDRPLPETGDWEIVPDLAIEVVSPNDQFEDVIAKMEEYFRLGVQEVWIVLPTSRRIYVHTSPTTLRVLTANDELDAGLLLGGLRLPVRSLFQPQPQTAPPATTAGP
jgi:Uma2 family endonuclease